MLRFLSSASLACLIAATASAGEAAKASGPLKFEDYLPGNSYLVGILNGLDRMGGSLTTQSLHALWKDPEVQKFAEPLMEQTQGLLAYASAQPEKASFPMKGMWELAGGRLGFAVGGMTTYDMMPLPSVMVGIDVAGREQAFQGYVERTLDYLPDDIRDDLVLGTFHYRGIDVRTIGSASHQVEACYAVTGNLFLACTSRHFLISYLDNYLGRGRVQLASTQPFQRAWSKVSVENPTALLYLNVASCKGILGALCPSFVSQAVAMTGLDAIEGITVATHVQGDGSRDVLYIDAPGPRRGVLAALSSDGIDPAGLGQAPADVGTYSVMPIGWSKSYKETAQELRQSFSEMLPPNLRGEAQNWLDRVMVWLPLNVIGDILEPMGDSLSYYVDAQSGGLIPNVVASVAVDNPWRVKTALDRLQSMLPEGTLKNTKYKGEALYYFKVSVEGVSIQPAFCVAGERLIIASQMMALKKAVAFENSDAPRLADNDEFKRCMDKLQGRPGSVNYQYLPSMLAGAYGAASPVLAAMISANGLPLNTEAMPSPDAFARHFGGQAISWSSDDGGILIEFVSPIGLSSMLESIGGVAHWVIDNDYAEGLMTLLINGPPAPPASQGAPDPGKKTSALPPDAPAAPSVADAQGSLTQPIESATSELGLGPEDELLLSSELRELKETELKEMELAIEKLSQQITSAEVNTSQVDAVTAVLEQAQTDLAAFETDIAKQQVSLPKVVSSERWAAVEGEHIVLRTDLPGEFAGNVIDEVDRAFAETRTLLGLDSDPQAEGRFDLYVTSNTDSYKAFGEGADAAHDAQKSSAYGQFCAVREGRLEGFVIHDAAEEYTLVLVKQAAAELAIRSSSAAQHLPRWMVEGLSCALARFAPDPQFAAWSVDALDKEGGMVSLRGFLHPFQLSRQSILQSGLMLQYVLDPEQSMEMRLAWLDLTSAIRKNGNGLDFALANLERALEREADSITQYAAQYRTLATTSSDE